LNATQCKMARTATGLGVRELATAAGVSPNTVARLERGEELKPATVETIRAALIAHGATFLDDDGQSGPGVRYKSASTASKG
jgi:transcriptional regulator with XRE-family HTH domain